MKRRYAAAFLLMLTLALTASIGHLLTRAEAASPSPAPRPIVLAAYEDDPPAETRVALHDLILPTSNRALFYGDGASFYQTVGRTVKGIREEGWLGGQYGFVRNPVKTNRGVTFNRFHAGIDIRPVMRDRRGEPLDSVRVVSDGRVVYANRSPVASNYGNYVVVEHEWGGSAYYTLYAHLSTVNVRAGQVVDQGHVLGRMGYTGRGINKERAHLHFEINLLLSENFEQWFRRTNKNGRNVHGNYNGINMSGLDVASFYLALDEDPYLTIEEFIAGKQQGFRVILPGKRMPELVARYPWLTAGMESDGTSWELTFDSSGLPLAARPSGRVVSEHVVTYVAPEIARGIQATRGLLASRNGRHSLTAYGQRYMELVAG
jgi:murein DD-endopeptidase MepM/ murein hydrolase activator NlpD